MRIISDEHDREIEGAMLYLAEHEAYEIMEQLADLSKGADPFDVGVVSDLGFMIVRPQTLSELQEVRGSDLDGVSFDKPEWIAPDPAITARAKKEITEAIRQAVIEVTRKSSEGEDVE